MIDDTGINAGDGIHVTLSNEHEYTGEFMNVDWAEDNDSGVDELCIIADDGTCYSFREDEIANISRER